MKFNEVEQLEITSIDHTGFGSGLINNRKALMPKTAPGDVVTGRLIKRKQGQLILKLEDIIKPSPLRVTPKCAYANNCGGCAWQHIDYQQQLKIKADLLNNCFVRSDVPIQIEEVTPAVELYYYRNRMDYCIGPKGEVGLKEPMSWNKYLDLKECHLMSKEAEVIMTIFRQYLLKNNLSGWDAKRNQGEICYLVIREGKNTDERLINIVTKSTQLPDLENLLGDLTPLATSIYHGINNSATDLSITDNLTLLHGKPYLTEKIGQNVFNIHPNSFFQTNSSMAEQLFYSVRNMVQDIKPATILDLYCGVGFFAIGLSDLAQNIWGVEIDKTAIELANLNVQETKPRPGLGLTPNIQFTAAKSEDLTWANLPADLVIIDPPRSGLHPKVIKALLKMQPKNIIYVSCNYRRFAEEWPHFKSSYAIQKTRAFDLFPHSPHVELVSWLKREPMI